MKCEHTEYNNVSNLENQKAIRRVGGKKLEGYCVECGERNSLLLCRVL